MNKIFEKIYAESDTSTNFSIFSASVVALGVYYYSNDVFLAILLLIGSFSFTKVILRIIISRNQKMEDKEKILNSYSKNEKDVIGVFVQNGTCFLSFSDLKRSNIELDSMGLDSLVARRVVEFIDNSGLSGPSGFQLSENVYKIFLQS
jgi:hypothetical protein